MEVDGRRVVCGGSSDSDSEEDRSESASKICFSRLWFVSAVAAAAAAAAADRAVGSSGGWGGLVAAGRQNRGWSETDHDWLMAVGGRDSERGRREGQRGERTGHVTFEDGPREEQEGLLEGGQGMTGVEQKGLGMCMCMYGGL